MDTVPIIDEDIGLFIPPFPTPTSILLSGISKTGSCVYHLG